MGSVVLVAALSAALSFVAHRAGANPNASRIRRTSLDVASGSLGGLAIGLSLGLVLGQFLGFQPGTQNNVLALSVAFALLGVVLGAMAGLFRAQRSRP